MWPFALSMVSGLAWTLCFPDFEWVVLAFAALIPLLSAIETAGVKRAFLLGLIAGLTHYLTLVYWIYYVISYYGGLPPYLSIAILLLLAVYLSLYPACFAALVRWGSEKGIPLFPMIPLLWTALEWIRGAFLTGFPWELLGYSLYRRLPFIQIADILGVYGVTFALVSANVALYVLIRRRTPWRNRLLSREVLAGILLLGSFLAYGHLRLNQMDSLTRQAPTVSVGLAQGNIRQDLKWMDEYRIQTLEIYSRLTSEAAREGAELVVWPETAAPFYFEREARLSQYLRDLAREKGIHLLFGSPAYVHGPGGVNLYNRAFLLDPHGNTVGFYDKSHLVPYGEYVPLKTWFSFLGKIVAEVGDFVSGKTGQLLHYDGVSLGPLICFESIFPYLSRESQRKGAKLLVNITNDAWFGKTSAPYQHFSMLVFRSVETRRFSVRAANTGISGVISATGEILEETPIFEETVLTSEVSLLDVSTLYSRYGDSFAYLCLAGALAIFVRASRRKPRDRRNEHVF